MVICTFLWGLRCCFCFYLTNFGQHKGGQMATHLSLEVDFIPGFIELVALHKNGHDVLG